MYIYALVSTYGEIIDICVGTAAAQEMNMNNQVEDLQIKPIMLYSEYEKQPSDYKGTVEGIRYLLYMGIDGKSTYGPVALLHSWGSWSDKSAIDLN
ncbi:MULTISPECIES: hypothetical protein [Paenibacillus]|uniref:Uncharacterized protein n=1 Tax=Paenibacillus odorifer TaxID=189426 RepID=A0A1R0X0T1_9BACL|nr:hypothetical protein [Paenibacillus odorifer]OMD26267.1 hypothetical protein BJP51_27695 [Paenibacillus odorifer]OME28849.1 hypothetical protein BSK63_23340 [Paenibacillus odorifer]